MINAAAFCWPGARGLEFERKAIIRKSGDLRVDITLSVTVDRSRRGLAFVGRYIAVVEFLRQPVAPPDLIPAHLWFDEFELALGTS